MACVWSLVSIDLFCVTMCANTEVYIKVENALSWQPAMRAQPDLLECFPTPIR